MNNLNQFSILSKELSKKLSLQEKKSNGIYFTPNDIIKISIDNIIKYKNNIINILEPSCGSCQFIDYIDNIFNNVNISGIELNKTIYDNIKNISSNSNNNINIINQNYLNNNDTILYDLIIGNPPYFVMKKKDINISYNDYYDGRPNIFILFIIHSLQKLNKNGILCFILPKNFMNCLYYNKLRNYINNNYKILNIVDCSNSNYIDTSQDTIIFIIMNTKINKNNSKYILELNNYIIFNDEDNIKKLKELYEKSTTLEELNFEVKVGNVIWNEVKHILTDDNNKTKLIYSSDIVSNNLIEINYKNKDKKNYINKKGSNNLILVINRGYGIGNYKFNYCLIDIDKEYLIENHLLIVKYKNEISREELKNIYNKIITSFNNIKTKEFVKIYFGNSAINTTELQYIFPIY